MNRIRHLYLAIVGDRPVAPEHQHTRACTPQTCDISAEDHVALRRGLLHSTAVDAGTIEQLRTALRPLANMHVEHAEAALVLCARRDLVEGGFAAFITMGDCHRAFYLLDDHNI